jgi:hypothetical protein
VVLGLLAAALAAGAAAGPAAAQDIAFNGWGVRAGASDDPDQLVVGVQADLGTFVPNLRFQPHADLGLGDDTTILSLTAPAHYLFPMEGGFTLYAGGGLTLAWIDSDLPQDREDDAELEITPMVAGGAEWPVGPGELSLELNLSGGDLPGVKLLAGWMF